MTTKAKDNADFAGEVVPSDITDFPTGEERDIEAVTRKMGERYNKAQNLDELFDALEGNSSDKLVGKTVEVHTIEWDLYESQDGPIPLGIVTAIDIATGEEVEFATTGRMVTRFLRRAQVLGVLPFQCRIEGKRTRSGQTALNLVRP